MFVLGIDPGLTRTGYGLVARARPPRVVTAGVIRTDPARPTADRLAELYDDLTDLVAQHRPTVMAIERIFTNRNLQTALGVVRASGVALLVAAQAEIPVVEYPPTTVKLAVTGDGNATKAMMGEMVTRRLHLEAPPRPADVADALAIALCHLQSVRMPGGRAAS